MELDENTKKQIEFIDKSSTKFKEIAQMEQGRKKDKFKNLGGELFNTARNFEKEIKKVNSKALKYHRYKYGSLIMVNYGLGVDAELCGNHFSIVLSNNDTPFDSLITVIPLTSKNGKNRLSLGELLPYMFLNYRKNILQEMTDEAKELDNEITDILNNLKNFFIEKFGEEKTNQILEQKEVSIDEPINLPQELVDKFNNCVKKNSEYSKNYDNFTKTFERYQTKNRISYVITNQIKTISKFRVLEPQNEYDPINKLLVPKEILLKIEHELIKKYFSKAEKLNKTSVDKK